MDAYHKELDEVRARIAELGRDPDGFTFAMQYLPPDPDGAGMFTVEYEVRITAISAARSLVLIGGIGHRWVESFADALAAGHFDPPPA